MAKALMVIDVQKWGFTGDWQVSDSDALLARIQKRVDEARAAGELIVHVQNDAPEGELDAPGAPFWPVMIDPIGDEWLVNKTTKNTFETNPDLAERLRAAGIDALEMVGCQSENCVRSTALGAKAEGFEVTLPVGLHGTYDEEVFTGKPGKTAVELIAEVQAEIDPR
ncbi:MAG: isochorismatase family protein [Micrococcales bacterium]